VFLQRGNDSETFFYDLINLTPLQHLIQYWFWWLIFAISSFSILLHGNKKPELPQAKDKN